MTAGSSEIRSILELARWAPSGDNTQPWRFEIVSDDEVTVHVQPTATENPYEYHGGQPTWLSVGGLLEYIRVAASNWRRAMTWELRSEASADGRINVVFAPKGTADDAATLPYLTTRSVDRRAYRTDPIPPIDRETLERALGSELTVHWYTSTSSRLQWARINSRATAIRLSIPEAYRVHQQMLDWESKYSPHGIPAQAVGLDLGTTLLMKWAMGDWRRLNRLNRFLAGTLVPRIQLDLVPGYRCAAFFTLSAPKPIKAESAKKLSWLLAGAAFQRFWLEAARLGLVLQPTLAPLAFATHANEGHRFTTDAHALRASRYLAAAVGEQLGETALDKVVMLGRVGYPRMKPTARSIRRPLEELLVDRKNRVP